MPIRAFRRGIWSGCQIVVVITLALGLVSCNSSSIQSLFTTATPTPTVTVTPTPTITPSPTLKPVVHPATLTPAPLPAIPSPRLNRVRFNMDPTGVLVIDPSLVELNNYNNGLQIVDATTIGLVRLNETTSRIEPGIAKSWDISPDGMTYRFHLRSDVPWVHWDSTTGQVVPVLDCNNFARPVRAADFKYGIERTMSSGVNSKSANLLIPIVYLGKEWHLGQIDPGVSAIQALDDFTLEVNFNQPMSDILLLMALSMTRAQPEWLIRGDNCNPGWGDRWTDAVYYQSYGTYVLKDWLPGDHISLVRNPIWPPQENIPVPQIDELSWQAIGFDQALQAYESGTLDVLNVPANAVDKVKADPRVAAQLSPAPDLCTAYIAFHTSSPVVNDIRVRQALSLAIDRQKLVSETLNGVGEPAAWFTRPGLADAPSLSYYPKLGVKYDPQAAQALMQEYLKGYALTAGQVDLNLFIPFGETQRKIAGAIAQMWKDTLGLDVTIEEEKIPAFHDLLQSGSPPQMWRDVHCYDYPDAKNFIRDQFAATGAVNPGFGGIQWYNADFENLMYLLNFETADTRQADLYAKAEDILVNQDAVIIPLYWYDRYTLAKPFINRPISQIGGIDYYEKWNFQAH